jgi:hypothetical protein
MSTFHRALSRRIIDILHKILFHLSAQKPHLLPCSVDSLNEMIYNIFKSFVKNNRSKEATYGKEDV